MDVFQCFWRYELMESNLFLQKKDYKEMLSLKILTTS
jgi:hypothetical protein